ncbi:MAG: hypothetical protein H0W83_09010 [Planctomycetes bacterium]|nr:hypothetical protein [Planctomycetota bacterium]
MPVVLRVAALVLAVIGTIAGAVIEPVTNAAGLKASIAITKQNDRWLIGTLSLTNTGAKAIHFKNAEGEKIGGFRAKIGDRDIPAEGGKFKFTKAAGAKLTELAPGMITDLEVKFKFDPKLNGDSYAWKIQITNLFVDDQKVDDLVLSSSPETKK